MAGWASQKDDAGKESRLCPELLRGAQNEQCTILELVKFLRLSFPGVVNGRVGAVKDEDHFPMGNDRACQSIRAEYEVEIEDDHF